MNEVLPADQYVTLSIYGKVNQDTNGTTLTGAIASTTLTAAGAAGGTTNNPSVEDASYSALAVNTTTVSSSDLTFSSSSAVLSGYAAVLGAPVVVNNTTQAIPATFTFTLTAGNNTLYISKLPGLALSTTTTGYTVGSAGATTTSLTDVTPNPSNITGDVTTGASPYYVVPAGSSRTFSYNGTISYAGDTPKLRTFAITAVKYGTSSSNLTANTITYNLGTLKVTPVI
jgi:hypothetical protein